MNSRFSSTSSNASVRGHAYTPYSRTRDTAPPLKFKGQNPKQEIGDIVSSALPDLEKSTQQVLASLTREFAAIEAHYDKMTPGDAKTELANTIRDSHKQIADEIIALATATKPSTVANSLEKNPKFADSTLGRFTAATYLQQADINRLPSKFYGSDMMAAQTIPKYSVSADLYPKGLFEATKPGAPLAMTEKLELLARFEQSSGIVAPLELDATYTPFVADQTKILLVDGDTSALAQYPLLAKAVKIGLPENIKTKIDTAWISRLETATSSGEKQWQTQFEGFETELLAGLCTHLDKDPTNIDMNTVKLAMSVAEKCTTPDAYQNVMARLKDDTMLRLVGRDADPKIKAMVKNNPQWKSVIGKRINDLQSTAQQDLLKAAMLLEVKLPFKAKEWVPKLGRTHMGGKDFNITPKAMLSALKENKLSAATSNEEAHTFCNAVDQFCEKPTEATSINALYQQACQLETAQPKAPLELEVRIALIKGIYANLQTVSEHNTTVADLGHRTWPKTVKKPLTDPNTIGSFHTSSYNTAMQAFQTEKGSSTTPKTLNDWVKFLKHDGDAKVAKYTAQASKAEAASQDSAKSLYTALVSDTQSFSDTMDKVAKALSENDIPKVRSALQGAIQDMSRTSASFADTTQFTKSSMAAKTKRLEVLNEMITACRRLDKGIVAMLTADKPTKVAETQPTVIAAKPSPKTPLTALKALTPITDSGILEALRPALRAYDAGIHATTTADIDTHIKTLQAEFNASKGRVKTERVEKDRLKLEVGKLQTKDTKLKELMKLIRTDIPEAQRLHDAAALALGVAPAPDGTGGTPGLYQDLFNAKAGLVIATNTFERHTQALGPLTLAVTDLTEERDRLALEVAEKRVQITGIQGDDGQGGQKAALTAELNTLRDVTIPELERQVREATATLADLANREAVTALDTQIAPLNQRIDELRAERTIEADADNPLLGEHRRQAAIDEAIADLSQQIRNLEAEAIIAIRRNGNAANLDDIRRLNEGTLRQTINDQTPALTTLRDNMQAATTRRDTDIPAEIAELNTERDLLNQAIDEATARLVTLNDVNPNSAGSIATATAAKDAKKLEVNEANARKLLLEGTILPGIRDQIATHEDTIAAHDALVVKHDNLATTYNRTGESSLPDDQVQAAIDANALLLNERSAELVIQTHLLATVNTKEGAIQAAITERETNLTTYAKAQRQAIERGTILGNIASGTSTLGDNLDTLITANPKPANHIHYKTLQNQLQNGLLGDAQQTITIIKSTDPFKKNELDFLKGVVDSHIETNSALGAKVGKKEITQKSKKAWIPGFSKSSQQIAANDTGKTKTLAQHLTFAEKYANARLAKADTQSADILSVVQQYENAVKGKDTPPLSQLLQNETPTSRREATGRLSTAISDIQTILQTATPDTKLQRIANELIDSLTELKSHIDKSTRKTAAGRSDKMGEVATLREALIFLSDDHLPPVPKTTKTGLKQNDFYSPGTWPALDVTPNISAKAMLPTAKDKLEKMGLRHTPETPFHAKDLSTEMCTMFLATIQDTSPTSLFASITQPTQNIINFRDQLLSTTPTPSTSLQALATRAKNGESAAIDELNTIFIKLKTTYATHKAGRTNLSNLKTHADSIYEYLGKIETGKAEDADIPTDTFEQKLLCTLGILVPTTAITIDDDAAESVGRLYEHRPLTMGLLIDVHAAAPHAASAPNVIRCMRTAFSQATDLSSTRASDTALMQKLCEASAVWSLNLLQQPWDQDQSPKAAVTNADRLNHTISAYTQACALQDRLSLEVVATAQHRDNLRNISDTIDHLLLDIQRGVGHTNTQGNAAVLALSIHDTPEKQLAVVGQIKIGKQSQSASSTPPARSHVKPKPTPVFTDASRTPTITRLPKSGLITNLDIAGTKYSYLPYVSDAPANSPKNALQALFGKPVKETFGEATWLRCEIGDTELQTSIWQLSTTSASASPSQAAAAAAAAENFLRQALLDIAIHDRKQTAGGITQDNAYLKSFFGLKTDINATWLAWLNDTATTRTHDMPTGLDRQCLNEIMRDIQTSTRTLSPSELLFIAALQGESIVILEPQNDGTYTATQSLTGKTPLVIEYVHGQYQRLESVGSKVAATKSYTPTPVNVTAMGRPLAARNTLTYGASFGETAMDTNITCWLEAAIYSAAYDPSESLITKMTEALRKNPPAATISPEKRAFLERYLQFLTAAKAGGHVSGIAALNQEAQALYFGEPAIRQQDPMDLLRPLHADLDTLLGNDVQYTASETLTVQKTDAWVSDTDAAHTYTLYNDRKVRLVDNVIQRAAKDVHISKYTPISIGIGNGAAGSLQDALANTDAKSDALIDGDNGAGETAKVAVLAKSTIYQASSVDELPNDYHITVSRPGAWNPATNRFELNKAPLLSPEEDGDIRYINLPTTIDRTPTYVRYNISQIIAHSGGSGDGGHYICFFQPDPTNNPKDWYIKTSNGNAATKLPGGYPDVERTLGTGNYTYTYMGVKA